MGATLKQVGGNVKVSDINGGNLGYFDRSQVQCNYNPLDNTVSITMIGDTVLNLPPVSGGGVLSISTIIGGDVDIIDEATFEANYALLFPKVGGGTSTPVESGIFNATIDGEINCTVEPVIGLGNVECFYIRVGNVVNFTGQIVVQCPKDQSFSFLIGNLPGVINPFLDSESAAGTFTQNPDLLDVVTPNWIPSCGIVTAATSPTIAILLSGYTNTDDFQVWTFSVDYVIR